MPKRRKWKIGMSKFMRRKLRRLKLEKIWGKARMKRPSPPQSATTFKVGAKKQGNDGNMYVIVADLTGRHRWSRIYPKAASILRRKQKIARDESLRDKAAQRLQRKYTARAVAWARRNPRAFYTMTHNPGEKSSALSRRTLIARLRVLRDAWGEMTTRNQDLSDERLASESDRELRGHYDWYYSQAARGIISEWLGDFLSTAS